jgi:PIN domain nuclease of toxin-antitoxin system
MKLLLDTHLLLWAFNDSVQLSKTARRLIVDPENELFFSVVSLWEIVIKTGRGNHDFQVDARVLRRELMDNGYQEIIVDSLHALAVATLPPIHRDPFDRLLIAQSMVEGTTLLTVDAMVAQYPAAIRLV